MDSTGDTMNHIKRVREILWAVAEKLENRGLAHDHSKLEEPEKSAFDEFTPKLRGSTYGSEEYKGFLAAMKPALDHHYEANRHHPEHFSRGIYGMTLIDLVEMLKDDELSRMDPDPSPMTEEMIKKTQEWVEKRGNPEGDEDAPL